MIPLRNAPRDKRARVNYKDKSSDEEEEEEEESDEEEESGDDSKQPVKKEKKVGKILFYPFHFIQRVGKYETCTSYLCQKLVSSSYSRIRVKSRHLTKITN